MKKVTKQHNSLIFQDKDGRWKTYIPTFPKRTLIAYTKKDKLVDKINSFYETGIHKTNNGEEKLSKEMYEYREEKRLHKKHKITKHQEYVYFISDGEYVKIGKANNILRRMSELQTGNARKLNVLMGIKVTDSFKAECSLHKLFKENNISNEWFDIMNSFDKGIILNNIIEFSPVEVNVF